MGGGLERNEVMGINFKEIFDAKFDSIKTLTSDEIKYESYGLDGLITGNLKKKAPCVLFYPDKDMFLGYNIWVKDAKNCDKRFPHSDVESEFEEFQKSKKVDIAHFTGSAYILEDDLKKKYLLFSAVAAKGRKDQLNHDTFLKNMLEDLVERYGISKIFGQFSFGGVETLGDFTKNDYSSKIVDLQNNDIFGAIRENTYLYSFAEKYKMTNSQYMRFRIRAISSSRASLERREDADKGISYLIDLDDLAEEVKEQNIE